MTGLDLTQFRELIIIPVLQKLGMDSESAVQLVLGTAIQESRISYLKQMGDGPALGVFQMEPATHEDIWTNYLNYRPELVRVLSDLLPPEFYGAMAHTAMVGNLWYAAAMCRVHYYRVPESLPVAGDIPGQARYWKAHYNTVLGAGTTDEYEHNWAQATD